MFKTIATKKAFVCSEAFIKDTFNNKELMFMVRVSLCKSKSYSHTKENLIECKVIYEGVFDPSKEPVGLDRFSDKPMASKLNDHIQQAQLAFDKYVKAKEYIYDIEII